VLKHDHLKRNWERDGLNSIYSYIITPCNGQPLKLSGHKIKRRLLHLCCFTTCTGL